MVRLKQQMIHLLLLLITITVVSACNHPAPNVVSLGSSSQVSNCRIIQHFLGETCVSANPKRVIVLDTNPLDAVLALGIKPVGAPKLDRLSLPEEQTQGIEAIGINFNPQPSLEKIALLQPDLILGNNWNEEIYPMLSQIAPTVIAPSKDPAWKEDLRLYAKALNKSEEAEKLIQNYQARIQEFQQRMGNHLKETEVSITASFNYGAGQPARIYLKDSFMGAVIEETGLSRPPTQRREGFVMELSFETLAFANGDIMFVVDPKPEESTLSSLQRHPLWSQLNVVKQGQVYPVSYDIWVAQRNIGGANRILDDLFKYLIEENQS